MSLPSDFPRCTGQSCPSANNCRRHIGRPAPGGAEIQFAAFHVRREAGSDACDGYLPVIERSTFSATVPATRFY